MDVEANTRLPLEQIQADRRLIEELSSHGFISSAARDHALELLYPHKNWGIWISRLLLAVGTSLVLAGIIYFFAFNWDKIGPAIKLGSIQLCILGCLVAAYYQDLQRLTGKTLLLGASVLAGVFLAVFGQIYQTGADAYTLFMMWAVLIAGWVVLSEFAALWAIWLVVCNIFIFLWWDQTSPLSHDWEISITSILALFNLAFLALREYGLAQKIAWLDGRWTRLILIVPVLISLSIPAFSLIFDFDHLTPSVIGGAILCAITYPALYVVYRYKRPDMVAIAAIFISGCLIIEAAGVRSLNDMFQHADAAILLTSGLMTIALFGIAIVTLREISRSMEAENAK